MNAGEQLIFVLATGRLDQAIQAVGVWTINPIGKQPLGDQVGNMGWNQCRRQSLADQPGTQGGFGFIIEDENT